MLSKVKSFALSGIEGFLVDVEVDVSNGLPKMDIIGLGDTAIKESKERIKAAIKNSNFEYPTKAITCNLAPADIKKEGVLFDLPISLCILSASGQLKYETIKDYVFLGELGLNGTIKKANGILPILISAKEKGYTKFIIPEDNYFEASYIEGIEVFVAKNLVDVVLFFFAKSTLKKVECQTYQSLTQKEQDTTNDMKFVKGQKSAKRALEIAAAGNHNVLMIGPPGSGKTMLAKCFSSILPSLTFEEALECSKIHSVAGELNLKNGIILTRPFRSPHHTATTVSLVGGGIHSKPGDISLAHNGVLFLDELPEFSRKFIETMRQPLEDGQITVSRANHSYTYPSNFTLIASMNPCPCGNYGSKKLECRCKPNQIHNYLSKLSGPIMDRIDMHVEVDSVSYEDLTGAVDEEDSATIRARVQKAKEIQTKRKLAAKQKANGKIVKEKIEISQNCKDILSLAFENLNLSARAHDRILKVARTIADLENEEDIKEDHILEALGYRSLDRKYWV